MSQRLRRFVKRLGLVLLVLLVLGVSIFTWIAFWPLEGDVDDMVALVPADVDFVLRGSWKGLKATGWIQENMVEHPVVPELRAALRPLLDALDEQLSSIEGQINTQIPLGITSFSVEDDVLGSEVIAAGKMCEGWDPAQGPPTWREILLFTRVSWQTRMVSAIKHGFIRDMVGPDMTITDEGDGLFKLDLHFVRPTSLRARQVCGPGVVVPPQNVWYLRRVDDVLVLGNSEFLMREVGTLADFPEGGRSYLDRPWVELDAPSNTIAASVDLQTMEAYLVRLLEMQGPEVKILSRYLTISSLDRMNGQLELPSRDVVRGRAEIRYHPSRLARGIRDVYSLDPEPFATSAASLLPADDTFGALLLKTPPLHLIRAIYEDILGPGDRKLWMDNLRRMGRYENIEEFFKEFASQLGDTATIAVGRMSDVFDSVDYDGFYTDPSIPDPNWPALAMMVRLRRGSLPEELDAYLAERIPLLGASKELEKAEHRGVPYTRISLEMESADYQTIQPAYLLAQDHFIFSSNETYLRKIIDSFTDPKANPPLSADPTFQIAMQHLPPELHLAVFLDLEKLFRVPPTNAAGGQPRGFLWDQRNKWVVQHRDPNQEVKRYKRELEQEVRARRGGTLGPEDRDEIRRRTDDHWDSWQNRYPEFEEERRSELAGYRRLRALSAGIVARRPTLEARFALLLQRPDQGEADSALTER